jgi:hypothetical protein
MPDTHVNRLQCTVSSVGGSPEVITVSTAVTGFRTFESGDSGKTFSCLFIEGSAWEVATGCLYTHSGTTLTRGTLENSSTGSAISLTSAAIVSVIAPASLGNEAEFAVREIAFFTPMDNQPPGSDFATLDTVSSIAVLDFADTVTRRSVFVGTMPYGVPLGSGINVRLTWSAASTSTNNVVWSVEFEKATGHDIDTDGWDTATTATVAHNGVSGQTQTSQIICTAIDSIAAGDCFRIRVSRLGGDGSDSLTVDASLLAAQLVAV